MDILEDHAERVRHADKIRLDAMLVSAAFERSPFHIRDGVKPERARVFTYDVYVLPP